MYGHLRIRKMRCAEKCDDTHGKDFPVRIGKNVEMCLCRCGKVNSKHFPCAFIDYCSLFKPQLFRYNVRARGGYIISLKLDQLLITQTDPKSK